MHLGDLETEADDPLDEPGQRAVIWQLGAKGCRAGPQGDIAVVEFCFHRGARLAREGDLIGSHQGYPLSAWWFRCVVSVPGAWDRVLTLQRVIRL